MNIMLIGVIALVAFVILMFLGIPIPFAMLIAGFGGFVAIRGFVPAVQIMQADLYDQFASYPMTVVPMFGLMGFVANYSGLGGSLYKAINSYVGHWKGGLAMATQVACAIFGAICGSVPATIGTMSAIAYPEMRKRNYSPVLAGSNIAAGATISVLIPPGTPFIIYGLATETSVGQLFMAGILPGIILTLFNCAAILFMVIKYPEYAPQAPKASMKERIFNTFHGGLIQVLIVFLIAMGGMFAGFFTPTEAGAVGAFGIIIVTFVTRQLNVKKLLSSVMAAIRLMAMVFILLACANVFSRMLVMSKIPVAIGNYVDSMNVPNLVVLLAITIIFLILGMLTDLLSMMLITLPIFFPIVVGQLGYSPVWFGVYMIIMIGVGGITPPVGNGVFMVLGATRWDKSTNLSLLFKGIWPFVWASLALVILLMFVPQIATILPENAYGGA